MHILQLQCATQQKLNIYPKAKYKNSSFKVKFLACYP